jgi:hypothetical protein
LPWEGNDNVAIDQSWYSPSDQRIWRFSSFAYTYLSFTLDLDGWTSSSPEPTPTERATLAALPRLRTLMAECADACINDKNEDVLTLTRSVQHMLDQWEWCIRERWKQLRKLS